MTQAFNRMASAYWRRAHGYDHMKFTHDFRDDLQAILDELDSGRPFAFNRFADGELAILEQRDIPTADGWNSVNVSDKFRERLLAALTYRHKDYYVGLGCPCCNRPEWERLMKLAGREPDDPQVTTSNVFVNGNYETFLRSNTKKVQLIRPMNNLVNIDDDDLEYTLSVAMDYAREIDGEPLYIAAGPFGKILIHELHLRGVRHIPVVDVGSAIDASGRSYHDPNHPNRQKICKWAT